MNDKEKKIVEKIINSKANKIGVKIHILDQEKVKINDIECNGFFYHDPNPAIYIAKKNKNNFDYISLLLHEYCHALQFYERNPEYLKIIREDIDTKIDNWINGKLKLEKIEVSELIQTLLNVEYDCEKKVINLIKEENINIDITTYIKKGNAYLYFYPLMKKYKKWYKKAPYLIENIVDNMPSELMKIDIDKKIDKRISKLFDQCF